MPARNSYAVVTVSRITDATAFGKAVLLLAGSPNKILQTDGSSVPSLGNLSISSNQISDSSGAGRALLTTTYSGEGTAVPVIGSGGGSVAYVNGVSGTPLTSTDGVVTSAT